MWFFFVFYFFLLQPVSFVIFLRCTHVILPLFSSLSFFSLRGVGNQGGRVGGWVGVSEPGGGKEGCCAIFTFYLFTRITFTSL